MHHNINDESAVVTTCDNIEAQILIPMEPVRRKRRASSSVHAASAPMHNDSRMAAETVAPDDPMSAQQLKDRRFGDMYSKQPDFKQLSRLDPEFASM